LTADGLQVLGVSAADEGDYTCRAEVEAAGRYDERRIHVKVHGKFTANFHHDITLHYKFLTWPK